MRFIRFTTDSVKLTLRAWYGALVLYIMLITLLMAAAGMYAIGQALAR